ncbi:MAG: hypothetical protein U0984_09300 [Prosthecobacter sp.]|nr:hypothetical protein [Prosthecobacter sp.]
MVVMLQQHLTVVSIAAKQSFLGREAPKIGDLLGRIFNQADSYFVYTSRASAAAGDAPVLTNGRAVRLFFKSAAQQTVERMISVETTASGTEMRFYTPQADGTSTSWLVCNQIAGANFLNDQGILAVTLQGPNGEEVTYSGGAR